MKSIEKPLISIVVPAYNVSDFLDRCIESLVEQTYSNLEIIIIDDGSKDSTGSLCDIWEKRDSRIKVIHKENQGLGLARNTGLQYCKGKYISFIDSDDFVEKNMYEIMVDVLEKENADTCYCSHNIYSNIEKRVIETASIKTGIYSGKEILLDIVGAEPEFSQDCVRQMSVCMCLFSNEIIRKFKLQFVSEREYICEDLIFDISYLSKSEKVVVISDNFYNYCTNETSLTHKYQPNRLDKEKYLYKFVCDKLKLIYFNNEYQIRYDRLFLGRVRNCILQEVKESNLKKNIIKNNIRKIISDEVVKEVVFHYPINRCIIKQKIFNYALKFQWINVIYILAKLK